MTLTRVQAALAEGAQSGLPSGLLHPAVFMTPRRISESAWHHHIPFAFLITALTRPRVVVELGTHNGDSYCAFCQAVDELKLETACYAVDTWRGDEHAGFYGEEVFKNLSAYHNPLYGRFSRLVRSTFDDALPHFSDGGVDLLHIDGLHTYEAVKHDIEAWLPKMSDRGLLLLHDTNVREQGFGVWRVWGELRDRYPAQEFKFGHGLGLLAPRGSPPAAARALIELDRASWTEFETMLFSLGDRVALSAANVWLKQTLVERSEASDKREAEFAEFSASHARLQGEAGALQMRLAERDGELGSVSHELAATQNTVRSLEASLADRDAAVARARLELSAAVQQNVAAQGALASSERKLASVEAALLMAQREAEKEAEALAKKAAEVDALTGRASELALGVANRDHELSKLKASIATRDAHILRLETERQSVDARVGRVLGQCARNLAPNGTWRKRIAVWAINKASQVVRRRRTRELSTVADSLPNKKSSMGLPAKQAGDQRNAEPFQYQEWIRLTESDRCRMETADNLLYRPWISVLVPVYKVPSSVLKCTLDCLLEQSYPHWQLCVAYADVENDDNWALLEQYRKKDSRVHLRRLTHNAGISANSNECLEMAGGEFIALLDHDDEMPKDALWAVVDLLNIDPLLDFIYTDKDCLSADGSRRLNPLFKPEWSPEMLYSVNYLTHLNVIRTSLVREVGGFRSETDGAQDWDLFLRVTERTKRIKRLTGVFYHWRILPSSTASGIEAKPYALKGQLKAIGDHLERRRLDAVAEPNAETGFRIRWRKPDVRFHIVVSGAATPDDLVHCVGMLVAADLQQRGPIKIVATEETAASFHKLWEQRHGVLSDAISLVMAEHADIAVKVGECLLSDRHSQASLLVSGGINAMTEDCITDLAGWVANHPEIGFASAVIVDHDDRVIEAGAVCGASGTTAPLFRNEPLRRWGVFGGPLWHRNVRSASPYLLAFKTNALSTAACLKPGVGLNRAIEGLCAAVLDGGLRGVVVPNARAILSAGAELPVPEFDASLREDPFFHPAFQSVKPLLLRNTSSDAAP
jgi:O-antigen biosynthesis protein